MSRIGSHSKTNNWSIFWVCAPYWFPQSSTLLTEVRAVELDVCVQRESKELKLCDAASVPSAGLSAFRKNVFIQLNPPTDVF